MSSLNPILKNFLSSRTFPLTIAVALLVLGGTAYLIIKSNQESVAAWYNSSWNYRKLVQIDPNKVTGSSGHTNFPMLFSRTDDNLKSSQWGGAVASSTAGDVLFVDWEGNKIDHEIESYSSSTGELIAWVEVPFVSSTSTRDIYIYYGNSGATYQPTNESVWDSNYTGVWHLGDGDSTDADFYKDSTSNNADGQLTDADTDTGQTTGQIGKAIDFSGDADYINFGATGLPTMSDPWMMSGWITYDTTGLYPSAIGFENPTSVLSRVSAGLDDSTNNIKIITSGYTSGSGSALTVSEFYYVTMIHDGTDLYMYINGQEDYSVTPSSSNWQNAVDVVIAHVYQSSNHKYWDGIIDEVRVSNIRRSDDWIATEYRNQKNPNDFYSVGGAEAEEVKVLTDPGSSFDAWHNTSWQHRKKIVIDPNQVGGGGSTGHTNFPMLYSVTDSDLRSVAHGGKVASSTAGDVLFVDWEGNKIDHEIEQYDSSTGELNAWVEMPFVSSTTTRELYIYYGNGSAAYQPTNEDVWDSNYKGVWHLDEGDSTAADFYKDSTTNSNDGTLTDADGDTTDTTGQIDGSIDFAGDDDDILTGENATINNLHQGTMTLSAWIKPDTFGEGNYGRIFDKASFLFMVVDGAGDYNNSVRFWVDRITTDGDWTAGSAAIPTLGIWHYVSVSYDGSDVNNDPKIYVDGVDLTTQVTQPVGGYYNEWNDLRIGDNSTSVRAFDGIIDESRVSNTIRSADWIKTEYNNQSSTSTFYTIFDEDSLEADYTGDYSTVGWNDVSWLHRRVITIDDSKVSGASGHTNFPMLFRRTDPNFRSIEYGGKVASSTAGDIMFTDWEGNKVDHEIESYDAQTGELITWIEVPFVSSTSTRDILMYFGSAGASYQPTNEAVWDSNYQTVHHLNESSSTRYDSTTNNQDCTPSNITNNSSGKIGGSDEFNGTDSVHTCGSIDGTVTSNITMSAWVHMDGQDIVTSDSLVISAIGRTGETLYNSALGIGEWDTAGDSRISHESYSGGWTTVFSTNEIAIDEWVYIAITNDGSTTTFYTNGSTNGTASFSPPAVTSSSYMMGTYRSPATFSTIVFDGFLDEVRYSTTIRSADWIATEYQNQSDPDTFYTFSAETVATRTASPATPQAAVAVRTIAASGFEWYNSSWTNSKKIMIRPTKVSGSTGHTNFPMLFSETDADLADTSNGGKVASSTAGDILFVDWEGNKIDHEIESYDNTTGEIIAWVKVPFVSSTSSRDLYIYYGNGSAAYQPTNEDVWSDYEAVYHLREDSSGNGADAVKDSTSNARHLTPSGSPVQETADTILGNAIQFDGINDKLVNTGWDWPANNGAVSVTGWNYVASTGIQESSIFSWNTGSGNERFQSHMPWSTGDVYFDYGTCCTTGRVEGTGYSSYDDKWTHFALRAEGNSGGGQGQSIYFDSTLYASNSNADAPNTILSADFEIGHFSDGTNRWHKGKVDELRIRNEYLTDSWIITEYNNQFSPSTFYVYGARGASSRTDSSDDSQPVIKIRGGVKFRFDLWLRNYLSF